MPNEEMGSRALPQPADIHNRVVLVVVGGFLLFVGAAIAGMLLFLNSPGAGRTHAHAQSTGFPRRSSRPRRRTT